MATLPPLDNRVIGIGCSYLTSGSITRHDERLISAVIDEGATHFDVAPQYGLGTAEAVLGRVAKGSIRNQLTIASKVGIQRPCVPSWKLQARALSAPAREVYRKYWSKNNPFTSTPRTLNFDPAYIERSLNESLKLLNTDYLDVFFLHMPRQTDVSHEVIATLLSQKAMGKAIRIGIATDRDEAGAIVAQWPGIFDVIQFSWSALDSPLTCQKEDDAIIITHRALARALLPVQSWLANDREALDRLSSACDTDLSVPSELVRALIGASIAENQGGLTLVASHSISRSVQNVRAALRDGTLELGRALIKGLSKETCPPPLQP